MKKLYIFAAFAACAFGMNAQLTVFPSGNVNIGMSDPVASTTPVRIDPSATLNVSTDNFNGGGAYITFGYGKSVGMGEYDNSDTDILNLFGTKGLYYTCGSKIIFAYNPVSTSGTSFTFHTDVKANSFLTTSDARMKKDVKGIDGISSVLWDLAPVSYRLSGSGEAEKLSAANADTENLTPMTPDDRVQYGFVAQEVREILPELVVEDENGYLSIDYLGFIPILVDAYKNLEARVKEQDETIAALGGANFRKSPTAGVDALIADGKALLMQNKPNPFKESTAIECVVPDGSTDAFICVYDLQGSQVKRLNIGERGNCSVTIDGSSLKPGMYIYALIVDGKEIDTKKMILTD